MPWRLQNGENRNHGANTRTGYAPAPNGRRIPDETDYDHRHFVNLAAIAFLLALAFCLAWTVKIFDEQLELERCIASGRKDCVEISTPPARSYRRLVQ